MLAFAEKVTLTSSECNSKDLDQLRKVGYSDEEILQITLVVCHYGFMGRLTDALGVKVHPEQVSAELADGLLLEGIIPAYE
ncbi:hypothetical protein FIM02_03050 [SAR202 cluster bacterium AD-802-E10_MRT_200m]|nr:hypothetical protein [SAR202 cluster bacterium AD-802-E10_MRT_200m]